MGGTPKIDGLCHGTSHLRMDENWGYPPSWESPTESSGLRWVLRMTLSLSECTHCGTQCQYIWWRIGRLSNLADAGKVIPLELIYLHYGYHRYRFLFNFSVMYVYIYIYVHMHMGVVLNSFARKLLLRRPWANLARFLHGHSPVWVLGLAYFCAQF